MSRDTFYSLLPLNLLLRCLGLSNVYRKKYILKQSGSKIKTSIFITIFGLINIVYLYHKTRAFQGNPQSGLIRFSDSVQMTYWLAYFQYIVDLIFVYKYGRDFILNYFKTFNFIDRFLGFPYYDQIRRTIVKSLVYSFVIGLLNAVLDYVAWVLVEGWKSPTIYSIDYFFFFINMLTVLDMMSHVIQVEYRLKLIGDLLPDTNSEYCMEAAKNSFKNSESTRGVVREINPLDSLKTLSHARFLEAVSFDQCYLQLLNQVNYINSSYGFRILVYCVNVLINMIGLLNLAIRVINGTLVVQKPNGLDFVIISPSLRNILLPTISSVARALNYKMMVIILVYRCEETYKQSENILETIDTLLAHKKTLELRRWKTNLLEFRDLLITRPIKFHAAKFFTMDYTLIVSLNSVVVTYTIILLQSMK